MVKRKPIPVAGAAHLFDLIEDELFVSFFHFQTWSKNLHGKNRFVFCPESS